MLSEIWVTFSVGLILSHNLMNIHEITLSDALWIMRFSSPTSGNTNYSWPCVSSGYFSFCYFRLLLSPNSDSFFVHRRGSALTWEGPIQISGKFRPSISQYIVLQIQLCGITRLHQGFPSLHCSQEIPFELQAGAVFGLN